MGIVYSFEWSGRKAMTEPILHFRMERHDDEDGVYYVVNGPEIHLTTDGETIEEALRNLREAVELYYEGDNLPQLPRIKVGAFS
jgi:predicted RNase H-like HicB family nuclease